MSGWAGEVHMGWLQAGGRAGVAVFRRCLECAREAREVKRGGRSVHAVAAGMRAVSAPAHRRLHCCDCSLKTLTRSIG